MVRASSDCMGLERRAALIAANPEIYYVTDHYAGHPTVLVRLSRIGPDKLRDLLGVALQSVSPAPKKGARHRSPR
jgi:hypothetical protein